MNFEEQQYLNILYELVNNGVYKGDRTGTGTYTLFCRYLRFDLSKSFPLLTTKKVFIKGVIVELLWFLSGNTNIQYLVKNNVHIWDDWCYQKYVQSFDLGQFVEKFTQDEFIERIKTDDDFAKKWGDLGDAYGKQWRNYGEVKTQEYADTGVGGCGYYYDEIVQKGFDQISWVVNEIKNNPDSRRLLVWAWNPQDHASKKSALLPPCHMGFQVQILDGKLNLVWTQRSADTFLGTPFNIASYAILTHLLAHHTGYEVGELVYEGHDVHLYANHIEQAKEQLSRKPFDFPQLKINYKESIFDYELSDFEIVGYQSHASIKAPIAV